MSNHIPALVNTPENFVGGKFFDARLQWENLSKDKWIHDVVHGKFLDFVSVPTQNKHPSPIRLSVMDQKALDSAMCRFLEHKIVERCAPGD